MLELDGVPHLTEAPPTSQLVSLRVGAGEAVCLVGRNGAGKTTTIESTMGILPIRGAESFFQDRDITRLGSTSGHASGSATLRRMPASSPT